MVDTAAAHLVLAFTSLLAIINPLGAVPIFMAMTAAYDPGHRRRTVSTAVLTAFFVLVVFATLGTYILAFFGITTPAFQIAGGIIFFGIGWDMLQARRSRVKTTEEEEEAAVGKEDVGIIPLGMPTLAGPGAITTVIALMGQTEQVIARAMIYLAIVLVLLVCWVALSAAPYVMRRVGPTGRNVMTRIMGLLVMVIGAQFIINGASTVIRDLL
jgi:multiple antibiotic resistance protein